MSLDSQPALNLPTTDHPLLLRAQLNGAKHDGRSPETKQSFPSSERLQVINDEKNFTLVSLTRINSFQCSMTLLQTPLGLSDRTLGFARCRLQLQHSSCLRFAVYREE